MSAHDKIDYVEFPATEMEKTKAFFMAVFGWEFTDYGLEYMAFSNAGLAGGFYRSELRATTASGSALVVLYSQDLAATEKRVLAAGGVLLKPVFDFPGGRRFHFADPSGNEFAVWSDA